MTKKVDAGGWTGKNKMPAPIPPYKTPRQVNAEGTRTTRSKKTVVLITETEEQDSDSEEETQFGLVWKKMTEEQIKMAEEQIKMAEEQKKMVDEQKKMAEEQKKLADIATKATEKDTPKPKKTRTIVLITETEETEMQASDNEEDNIPVSQIFATELQRPTPIQYVGQPWKDKSRSIVLIPETEETERQASDNEDDNIPVSQILARKEEVTSGQSNVGKTVMKQFEAGLFCGQVVTAIKKRGRFLYHVLYEDGDEEDFNDQELQDALELHGQGLPQ